MIAKTQQTSKVSIYPYSSLGHVDHGWLNARHHFSFGGYQNPDRVNFGALRVINDDRIQAGKGFAKHPHQDMEIITYVRSGAITHEDSIGNKGRTEAGDIQVMSAGHGVFHSEYNNENVDTTLFQIWIFPNQKGVEPRWETKQFPKEVGSELKLVVSGREEDKDKSALFIYQDAAIYAGNLKAGISTDQPIKHQAYVIISKGKVEINGHLMQEGDGGEFLGVKELSIKVIEQAEILVIDVVEAENNQ